MTIEEQNAKGAVIREGSRRYFDAFCVAMDPQYEVNWHHEILCRKLERALEDVMAGKKVRIIISMPPRHGKSETATVKFPAFALGKYPQIPIIVTSYGDELAAKFGLQTRDLMVSSEYMSTFKTRIRKDQKAKGNWQTTRKGGYTVAGIGGAITGKGFKIGIVDDPIKSREEADSLTYREKTWNWYKGTFYTRQEGFGAIIVIATRWHKDDLIGRLKKEQEQHRLAGTPEDEYDQWDEIVFPAIAEEDEIHRNAGEALWPGKFPLPILQNIKNTVGKYEWYSQYQASPIASDTQEFHEEDFRYYEPNEIKLKNLVYYTLTDPAPHDTVSREKADPDNVVVRTIGKQKDEPYWYMIEETAGRMDPLQHIDAIFMHHEKYRSDVWVEGVAYQKTLEFWIKEEMRKRQIYFNVHLLKRNTSTSKEARIRGLIPLYKAHVVMHRKDGSDAALEKELLDFPKGDHDDRPDCLANGLEAVETTTEKRQIKKTRRRGYEPQTAFGG